MTSEKKKSYGIELSSPAFSRTVFYILSALSILGILAVGIVHITGVNLDNSLPEIPCSFRTATGLYCPGCGGTRAFLAILNLNFVESFLFHPVLLISLIIIIVFIISHILNILSKDKIRAMRIKPVFFFIVIGIILLQWIIKNMHLLSTGAYYI